MGHRNAMQPECSLACLHSHTHQICGVCAPFSSAQLGSVLFCSVLFVSFVCSNGKWLDRGRAREWVAAIKRVWLKNSYYYYYYPHSHTHRIQMRNENLMILFALLFASFRNLFILHSSIRSSVCSFVHLFVGSHSFSLTVSCFSLCSHLFNEQTHDHY